MSARLTPEDRKKREAAKLEAGAIKQAAKQAAEALKAEAKLAKDTAKTAADALKLEARQIRDAEKARDSSPASRIAARGRQLRDEREAAWEAAGRPPRRGSMNQAGTGVQILGLQALERLWGDLGLNDDQPDTSPVLEADDFASQLGFRPA